MDKKTMNQQKTKINLKQKKIVKTQKIANKLNTFPTRKANKINNMHSNNDIDGSYTGVPNNPYSLPVQDVDDL